MSQRAAELLGAACSHPGHRAGTDAERRVAGALARELRSAGLRPETEHFWSHSRWPWTHLLHCLAGGAGSLAATALPALGFGLVLLAAASYYLDTSSRWYLLRRLSFRRASQNVAALPDEEPDGDLIVVAADYDAPLTGAAYGRFGRSALEAGRKLVPPLSPTGLVFWSLALLVPMLGARMAGIEAGWLSLLQLPPTLVLLVAAFLYGEIALSVPSPAGNVNGAGVAAAIRAVELARERGTEAGIGIALCGAGDCDGQGARTLVREQLDSRPERSLVVVGIEGGGVGEPAYARRTGGPISTPAHPQVLEAADDLAEGTELTAIPMAPGGPATVAGRYGYPAIQLCAREGTGYLAPRQRSPVDLPEACHPASIERTAAAAADLIALLDRRLARLRSE